MNTHFLTGCANDCFWSTGRSFEMYRPIYEDSNSRPRVDYTCLYIAIDSMAREQLLCLGCVWIGDVGAQFCHCLYYPQLNRLLVSFNWF